VNAEGWNERAQRFYDRLGVPRLDKRSYRLAGTDAWVRSSAGEKFSIGANSSFDIRVTEPYHYICHYG
jgi:hypothetical protein